MTENGPAQPSAIQTAAAQTSAQQSNAAATVTDAKPAQARGGAVKGDMRAGVGFWSMGTMVAGIASDLAKPVANLAPYLLGAFVIAAVVCAWLAFFRKPAMQIARTLFGASAIGVGIFGFFLLAPLLAGSQGDERGIIAAVAPPIAAVQTAVLPLSPTEKELLTLGTRLSSGDPEARSAAARAAISNPDEDKAIRRAKLERILKNGDPNIQQAGIVQALADRGRAPLPVIPAGDAPDSPLKTFLIGAEVGFSRVDVETGAVTGALQAGGGTRAASGTVANGRLIVNGQYARDGRWKNGLVLDVRVGEQFRLIGTVRTPEDPPVDVEIPLL
jgi:hypothetical protein